MTETRNTRQARPTRDWTRLLPVLSLLLFGLCVTGGAALFQAQRNREMARQSLDALVLRATESLQARLASYEYGLRGARGVFLSGGKGGVDRARFREYSQSLELSREFPGARGFGIVRRVEREGASEFLAQVRHDRAPRFEIRQLAEHDGDLHVIQFMEPLEHNGALLGLDMASDPEWRLAAEHAATTGLATLTPPSRRRDAAELPLLLFLPIYAPNEARTTPEQRRSATLGWAMAALSVGEVLGNANLGAGLTLTLRDAESPQFGAFFASAERSPNDAVERVNLRLYERTWQAEFRATPAFFDALRLPNPWHVALSGAGLTALLTLLVSLYAQSSRRQGEVLTEQARRAAIVDSTSDAIIGETFEGVVTDWNRAAEVLFGYSAESAIGRRVADLILPEGRTGEDREIREAVARGEPMPTFDTVRRRADGSLLDVAVTVSPIVTPGGARIGFSKAIRDISERKRAEEQRLALNAQLERQVVERTQLLDSARRDLQNILDAVPALISYWDRDLRNRFANKIHERWFGWDVASLPGTSLRELQGDRFENGQRHFEAALRGETLTVEQTVELAASAGARHVLAQYVPDVLDGEVRGFYVFATDITEQTQTTQQLAAALREKDALLRAINEHAIVSVTDRSGTITEVNEGFCKISGYTPQELLGKDHRVINSGKLAPEFWRQMWRTIAAGKTWRGEICNRAKDGSLYWVDSTIAPYTDAQGQVEKYISVRFDVTKAKQAQQALLASEAFLDRAGRVAGIGAWQLDVLTQKVSWSTEMYRLHELDQGSVPDLETAIDFYPDQARERVRNTVRTALETQKGWDVDLPFTTSRGRELWVRSVGEVECEGGVAVRLVGTMQDITARVEAERARRAMEAEVQRSHERVAIAADAAGIGVWEYDVPANLVVWDDWMYRIYGRTKVDGGQPYSWWTDALHPDDRTAAEEHLTAALSGERPFDTEFRILRRSGEVRFIRAAARVARDDSGAPLQMTGVNIDITDRKRAELELTATSSLLSSVLDSASEISMIATDPSLTIKVFNRGAERMLGYLAEELVDRTTPGVLHDPAEMAARARELSRQSGVPIVGGEVFTHPLALRRPREWTYVRKDGTRLTVSLVVTAMRTHQGQLVGYLGIAQDVTLQKLDQARLLDAMRKAEHANRAKSEFLANMSHEIRTPMNAVVGLSYLLAQTSLSAEQSAFLSKISAASSSLLALINDILDFSKIEAGELSIERVRFDLAEVLHRVIDAVSVEANRKRLTLTLDAPEVAPEIEGDVTRLAQILTNLLANAVKFTVRGTVTLRVRRISIQAGTIMLRFEVEDTGIGIAPAARERLFSPFVQADASTTRRFGGTGLGLSIVKRLAELMGGEVGLESEPGRGSTFWVELGFGVTAMELAEPATAPNSRPEAAATSLVGARILVVDDAETNLYLARHVLTREGAKVSMASNGREALDRLATEPDAFDAVLMDVQMPIMDGYEATRRIREELGLTSLPIIALTADARTSERTRCVAAGMDDFISKPFDPPSLVQCLKRRVRQATTRRIHPPAGASRTTLEPQPTSPAVAQGAQLPAWPELDGIDSKAAHARFSGDVRLFGVLLDRILAEYADMAVAPVETLEAALPALADRAHKLRGSAGQVGAEALSEAAGLMESAARAGDLRRVESLRPPLAAQIQLLCRSAEQLPLVVGRGPANAVIAPVGQELDLKRVIELLKEQDLSVLAQIRASANSLRRLLGNEEYPRFSQCVENMDFQLAAATLERRIARAPTNSSIRLG